MNVMPLPPALLSIDPAGSVPLTALRDAFNAAFADYLVGPPRLRTGDWDDFVARQGVDMGASRLIADENGQVLVFALIGRRGAASRLATMGARPQARGTGLAPRLLDHVLDEARLRGDDRVELEVFARNLRALALYRSRGFAPLAELHGYTRAPHPAAVPADAPKTVGARDAVAWLREQAPDGLPFQVGPDAIEAQLDRGHAFEAWQAGAAQLVFSVQDAAHVAIASLVDPSPAQAGARTLVRELAASYPAATLSVPPLQRLDAGGAALEAEGWKRLELHQLLMRLPLAD